MFGLKLKNEQGLLKILSEVYACYWGQIIYIYKLIEKPDTKEVPKMTMNNLFDNIIKKMVMDYGFNEDSCKKYKSVSELIILKVLQRRVLTISYKILLLIINLIIIN